MTQLLVDLVGRLGYAIVLLGVGIESMGIPVPGETALVIGAVAAAQGRLHLTGVVVAGVTGAVVGDNIGYWVGRRWGRGLVRVRGVRLVWDERRMAVAERFFERRGWVAVFLGRFVALLRIFAGPLAGMHHMPWPRFVVANAAGAILWVGAVTAVGFTLGSNLDRAIHVVKTAGYLGLALAALVVAGWVAFHVRRSRRERREGDRLLSRRRGGDGAG